MEKERRNKWRKVCQCKIDHFLKHGDTCPACNGVYIDIERRKPVQNIVDFKTGERPRFQGKSKFPYERLIKSLTALADTTKCVILEDKKEFGQNNLTFLRKIMSKEGWFVKACKQDGMWNLWVVKAEVSE